MYQKSDPDKYLLKPSSDKVLYALWEWMMYVIVQQRIHFNFQSPIFDTQSHVQFNLSMHLMNSTHTATAAWMEPTRYSEGSLFRIEH